MPITRSITQWSSLAAFPPPYCRLLAKKKGGGTSDMAFTDAELALRANLPISRVREIAMSESWDGIPIGDARRFLEACDFDPTSAQHRARVTKYERICTLRKTAPFHYLRRSPKWETEFLPLTLMLPKILRLNATLSPSTKDAITHARS